MPSTFFGLTIASSGLSAYQIALNTTANNLSNLETKGYSRQQANRVAANALRVHEKYGTVGTGVSTVSITQLRNRYYDTRYWNNQSAVGLYETKLSYLQQIENYYMDDDMMIGFSTVLNNMFNGLDTLSNQSGDVNARQQFVGSAQNFTTFFQAAYEGLAEMQRNANEEVKSTVSMINAIAEKVANLNRQINVIEVQGGYANELRDQRALLIDELSTMIPVEVTETPVKDTNDPDRVTGANYYTVKVGGQLLVDTNDYETLTCVARKYRVNQSDQDGLYDVKWTKTGNTFDAGSSSMSGSLKALFDIRDGNNADNFTGITKVLDSSKIQILNPSLTNIETMTMPERGMFTINGRNYAYKEFSFEMDDEGNITSYTFTLENALSREDRLRVDGMNASIGAAVDTRGIPYYIAQMNQFLRSFGSKFNDLMMDGEDLNGKHTDYYSFFTGTDLGGKEYLFGKSNAGYGKTVKSTDSSYYKLTAENLRVADICVKQPDKVATQTFSGIESGVDDYSILRELAKLKSDTVIFRSGSAESFLKCMISDVSVDTQKAEIFQNNFLNIQNQIQIQRMSISGVDEDEEGADMLRFQHAYDLSSKMVSVMAEIYDKLIQETGV